MRGPRTCVEQLGSSAFTRVQRTKSPRHLSSAIVVTPRVRTSLMASSFSNCVSVSLTSVSRMLPWKLSLLVKGAVARIAQGLKGPLALLMPELTEKPSQGMIGVEATLKSSSRSLQAAGAAAAASSAATAASRLPLDKALVTGCQRLLPIACRSRTLRVPRPCGARRPAASVASAEKCWSNTGTLRRSASRAEAPGASTSTSRHQHQHQHQHAPAPAPANPSAQAERQQQYAR